MLHGAIIRASLYGLLYTGWVMGFRLIALTLITYFMVESGSESARFQDISDMYGSNEVLLVGLAAAAFVLAIRMFNPITSTSWEEILSAARFRKRFLPGFLQGAVLAMGFTGALVASGLYRYLGFFIQAEDGAIALGGVLLRVAGLVLLVYSEEFLFRHKILSYLRRHIPDAAAAMVTAILYCAIKFLQFDLGIMQLSTLLLLGIALGFRAILQGDFTRGAGQWAAMLIVFHALLSLPIFGNDFQGLLLVRYEAEAAAGGSARLITGGIGGPLSSFALQILFLFDIAWTVFKNKRILR